MVSTSERRINKHDVYNWFMNGRVRVGVGYGRALRDT